MSGNGSAVIVTICSTAVVDVLPSFVECGK